MIKTLIDSLDMKSKKVKREGEYHGVPYRGRFVEGGGGILAVNSCLEVETCLQEMMKAIEELILHTVHIFWLFDPPEMEPREPIFKGYRPPEGRRVPGLLSTYQPLDYQLHGGVEEARKGKLTVRRMDSYQTGNYPETGSIPIFWNPRKSTIP